MSLLRQHHLLRGSTPVALPTLVQSKFSTLNGSNTVTLTFTTVPALGDLIVIASSTAQDKTQVAPPGFFTLYSVADRLYIFYKIATASESNSYVIGIAGAFNNGCVQATFRNYNPMNPITALGQNQTSAFSSITVPSGGVTIKKYSYVLAIDCVGLFSFVSATNSFATFLGGSGRIYSAYREYSLADVSQQTTITYSGASTHFAAMISINPVLK